MTASSITFTDFKQEIRVEKEREATGANRIYSRDEHQALVAEAVEAAKEEAFAQGQESGKELERKDVLAEAAASLESISPKLEELLSDKLSHHQQLQEQVLEFVKSICMRIFPEIVANWGEENVVQQVEKTIEQCLSEPKLVVSTCQRSAYELRDFIEDLANEKGFKGEIQVRGNQEYDLGEVHVEWDNGFVSYSMTDLCDQIIEAIETAHQKIQNKD